MFLQLKMIVSAAVASLSQEPPTITFCHLFGRGNLRDLFWVIVLITPRDGKSTSHFGAAKAARIPPKKWDKVIFGAPFRILSPHYVFCEETRLERLSSNLNVSIRASRTENLDSAEGLRVERQKRSGSCEMFALSYDLWWKAGSGVTLTDVGLRLQSWGPGSAWSALAFKCKSPKRKTGLISETNPV